MLLSSKMSLSLYASCACLFASFTLGAGQVQAQANDTLPNDTAVTVGTLPNGLKYYVRVNHKPEHRAEFRLVVKAGSLMEDDDQRGLAHFVEHMAFNGTTHFKKNDLIYYLQSIGVRFGADLNASTGFDRTIFILPVPTDTLAQVKQALQILEDWAHNVTFNQADFDGEREVILGERRMHLGVGTRVQRKQLPVLLKGSRYPDRIPIGTKERIEHATRDQIVRFYKKWYRPDRMAIIAVGDFDKAQMVQMIRDQFSQIPKATTPLADPSYPIPPQPGTLVSVVGDSEVTNTSVSVLYKGPGYPQNTIAATRADLVRGLFDQLLNERLSEITQKPDAPFLSAGVGHGSLFTPDVSTVQLGVNVAENQGVTGLQGLLTEVERVVQHGFTQTELDRAKTSYLAQIENFYQNRNDRYSSNLVGAYISNFLTGAVFPSAETTVDVEKEIIPTITLQDVNQEANFLTQHDNRVLLVTQPIKADIQQPDTTALLALFQNLGSQQLAAYTDQTDNAALIAHLPTPGKIVSEKKYEDVGITQWTLSNGAVVLLKPTKFKADEILFSGASPGGSSLFSDSDYPTAAFMANVVDAGGLGAFSSVALSKRLSGKLVNVGGGVGRTQEVVSGSTRWEDVETMLQLVYLTMTAPRYDSSAVAALFQRAKISLSNRSANPGAVFQDTISATLSNHSVRAPLPSPALFDHLDPQHAIALYKDRFADASDFTFMFVGAFNPDSLKPLVEQYLASLPALHRHDTARDVAEAHPPAGVVKKVVRAGREAKAITVINFTGPYEASEQNANDLSVMKEVLQNRLTKRLREELGGTYGVSVSASASDKPLSLYNVTIQYIPEPSRREELVKATFAVIDSLKHHGPSAEELHRVIEPGLRTRERARRTNQYWLNALNLYEHKKPLGDLLDDKRLEATTSENVEHAAQQYLNTTHYEEFDLVPASETADTGDN
jgi:zinc protease